MVKAVTFVCGDLTSGVSKLAQKTFFATLIVVVPDSKDPTIKLDPFNLVYSRLMIQ